MAGTFNIAVLISGSGTTLRNLIERQKNGTLDGIIAGVLVENGDAVEFGQPLFRIDKSA